MIIGNVVGGKPLFKSFILETEDGKEIPAVLTEQEVVFDATKNDIRIGKKAATGNGVVTGEKVIPSYHTTEATRYIPSGSEFTIPLSTLDKYDYTKLQLVICDYKTSMLDSVLSRKVGLIDKMYEVGSDEEISTIVKDSTTKSINLGIINDSNQPCVIRYFTYKEIV